MDLTDFADEIGTEGAVTISGLGTRGGGVDGVRSVAAPAGIEWIEADEMRVGCAAGTPVDELNAALAEYGQRVALPPGGTVGGALALGHSGIRLLGDGALRNALLQTRYVDANGVVITAGGPTVKNVTGFDLCRLLVGSRGTLGFIGDVIVRSRPVAACSQWFSVATTDPWTALADLYRPVSVLWDGTTASVLLEGHAADVAAQAKLCGLQPGTEPALLGARRVIAPSAERSLRGTFISQLGTGVVYTNDSTSIVAPAPGVADLTRAIKAQFDPTGRLNPGVVVG